MNGWTATGTTEDDGLVTVTDEAAAEQLDDTFYAFLGDPEVQKSLSQTIAVSGTKGDSFVVAGWAKGDSIPLGTDDREFGVRITFNYDEELELEEDEPDGTAVAQFNADVDHTVVNWQFSATAAVAVADYSSVTVELVYDYNANTMYFDGIQLYKETFGTSYAYNEDGDVESVIDIQNKKTEYEYDSNNNLTQIIEDDNVKMTYTYDNHHNVETATTDEGLVYEFDYDDYGNNIKVSITSNGQTISSIADYTDNGDLLEFTKDALGNQTTYGYNEQTGLLDWVQYPEDTAATRTEYTYDEMYRTARVHANLNSTVEKVMSANYTYEDDLLKTIQTPSTTYSFTYGNFSLRTRVDVGNRNLASYTYEAGTNRLKKLDYGNGGKVEYTYDSQGRLIRQTYEDGATVSRTYDNSGNLATVTDSETGVVTTYYYDLLNRQSGYREKGANLDHTVKYEYDEDNNLASMTEVINNVSKTYTYTYDDDNRIKTQSVDGVTTTYTYDDFGRLSERLICEGNSVIWVDRIGYKDTTTTASGQIFTHNEFTYTYDANGNITFYGDDRQFLNYYRYDSQNQLVYESSEDLGLIRVWTYDDAGNITSRTEYDLMDEDLEYPLDTITYSYENSEWGDLLTSYEGIDFEYDTIGNLTDDGEWEYTWKHGRQLASMRKGNTTWTFTYDANGMRTQKTNGLNKYTYIYNGDKLVRLIVDAQEYFDFYFTYDAKGTPLTITENGYGITYYYITNLQGDVTGIKDSSGQILVNYSYDAWGNLLYRTNTQLAEYNPLRYRGYVYDWETGLYYLQSRYYNPEWGRFINADKFVATDNTLLGSNMFAYCCNNPIMNVDPTGCFPWLVIIIIGAIVVSTGVNHCVNKANENKIKEEIKPSYTKEEATVEINNILSNHTEKGVQPTVEFDKNSGSSVEIDNSYLVNNRYDRQKISMIIERTDVTEREYDNLSSEWLYHNILTPIAYESGHSANLDYDKDPRVLFVRIPTLILEIFGWE